MCDAQPHPSPRVPDPVPIGAYLRGHEFNEPRRPEATGGWGSQVDEDLAADNDTARREGRPVRRPVLTEPGRGSDGTGGKDRARSASCMESPSPAERPSALIHSSAPSLSPTALTRLLLAPARPPRVIWAILGVAAIAVGIAGFLHGRLFHQGYSQVTVIGPLFLLNELSSGVMIALLLLRRPWLFALGALGISVGAVISIVISHTTSLFGFAEHRYSTAATTIVVAECAAAALVLIALALAARLGLGTEEPGR